MEMRDVIAAGAHSAGPAEWVGAFLLSPGAAAVAAVVAAVLALTAARSRIRADVTMAREERRRAEASIAQARAAQVEDRDFAHWWDAYRWAVERADDDRRQDVAPVMSALGRAATTPVTVALAAIAWPGGSEDEQEHRHD
ncbi:hypothetical protein [Cellulomonas sp. Marseille-Q8402]